MDVELTLDAFSEARLSNAIQVTRNGQEALDYLFCRGKYSDREPHALPDLVLLDLKMPGIDGFKCCARSRTRRVEAATIHPSSKEEGTGR
jgi:CheY-like chemotaxis protein